MARSLLKERSLIKANSRLAYGIRNTEYLRRISYSVFRTNLPLHWLVFLATFAIYAALVPWMVRVWPRTGDEPHYLLAAHSLAFDGDFDLSNNYAQHDYRAFYTEPELNPHTRPGPRGEAVLTHNLGLSILLAPAYRLGGLLGVEYFLAALGALLAMAIFLLGYQLTGNWLAAAIGWLAISFTPPMLWYVFLVYPEMVAGLCLIFALRHFINSPKSEVESQESEVRSQKSEVESPKSKVQSPKSPSVLRPPSFVFRLPSSVFRPSSFVPRSGLSSFILPTSSLFLLPWLSSRYLPVLIGLMAWAGVRAWKERSTAWGFTVLGGLAGLGTYALFSLWLYGNASPVAAYAGPTPLGPETTFDLIRFARGLFGWLLDNQRGILVSAPIYIAAFWGGAFLLRRRLDAGLAILLPFGLLLGSAAVWGGFWIGWEYSARFVVAALPPLGAGVAYLWAAGRRAVVVPLTVMLLGLSILVGSDVILKPLRGLNSSPIHRLQPPLDIEALIPAMADYLFIPAGHDAAVGEAGGLGWQTTAGQSGIVLRRVDLPQFSFGWYTAHLPLSVTNSTPEKPVATIKIFSPRWGEYYSRTLYGRDVPASQSVLAFDFKSPTYDGWQFPPTVLVSSTGQADLSVGTLKIEPQIFHSLILPGLWLIALALLGIVVIVLSPAVPSAPPAPLPLRALSLSLIFLVIVSFGWSLSSHPRTHAAFDLKRTVGTVVDDSQAYQGQAIQADPEAGQEAGILAATLPEIYAPGPYRLTVSLLAENLPFDPSLNLAGVRLLTPDQTLQHWEIAAEDIPVDGRYHRVAFDFENPRPQALTFIIDYPATAGFRADLLKIEPMP